MSYASNNDTTDSATQKNTTITIESEVKRNCTRSEKEVKHSTTDNMDNNNSGGHNSGMYLFQNVVVGMSVALCYSLD